MKNIFLTLSFLGCAGLASAWFAPAAITWYEENIQTTEILATAENLIKDSGFDNADFSKTFTDEPRVYGSWVTYTDAKETNTVSYEVVTDPVRGKVGSFTGRSLSWYTSFFAQRIETTAKKGIYKLSFWGKSANGGKVKAFFRTTTASDTDGSTYFIKYTDQPTDPTAKWRGTYYNQSLSTEWKEYSVEFDFTKVGKTMYDMTLNDAVDATDVDLTNFTLCFQGENADKNILIDDVKLELVKDLSEPEQPEEPGDALIKDSGFDNADFAKTFDTTPSVFGEWVTYKDPKNEKNEVSYAVVDDATKGKVASYTGKPSSWYTSFFAQRIETTAKKGIYKLSFWGKSTDGGKVKTYIRLTDAAGGDVQKFFIKETGKPSDPASKWYGSFYSTSLTTEWTEYSVEFDFTKTIASMYSVPLSDAKDADEVDWTNFSICFQGDIEAKTILIDDVKLELVKDLSEPEPEEPTDLIKDADFNDADFTKTFDASPAIFGEWLTYKDPANEKAAISYAVVDDATKGKVASYTGKPSSWYTSFFAQRIETTAKKGIYKLSFWGKSADGGKAKVFIRLTDAGGKDVQKFFIKETGKPSDPASKWYGSYFNTSLTTEWAEYSVEFDLTKTITSMYSVPLSDAKDADEIDLTNFSICFQGDVADKTILIDNVSFILVKDLSDPEEPDQPGENLVKDSGFESNPDLTLQLEEPKVLGQWVAYKDQQYETKPVTITVSDDATQGKVVAITGQTFSWYTTVLSQRIEGTIPQGIYRFSFLGRSDDGGQLRIYTRTTDADNSNTNNFFIKETGKPSDPTQKWYGCWQNFTLTSTWKEYYVDFNLSKTANSMYQWTFDQGIVKNATDVDLTNMNICFLGNKENATVYIDNVSFTKIADIDEEDQKLIIQYDFEEATVPSEWKATGSELSLTKEHFKKGVQALCWNAADKATLELPFSKNLAVSPQNAAFFNIYSTSANNDTIYTEFLDANDKVVKKATILVNFKGWREFSRAYDEYANKANASVKKVRFIYAAKEGNGQKILLDNVDFNAVVDSKRQYPDMMVLDTEYLNADNSRLLKVYNFGADVVPGTATEAEIADLNTLKPQFARTPVGNTGKIRELLSKVSAMNIVRNSDGTVSGNVMPTPKELTLDYLKELSSDIEIMAASVNNQQVKTAFNNLVDLIIDQGILYNFSGLTYSDYTNVKGIPAGFLNAMNAYTDEQRTEIVKGVKWMIEFNLAYAPLEYILSQFSSDYIYNFLPNLYTCAVNAADQNEAVENLKGLTQLLENASEYAPGSNDILKPDGTGFHHNTQYNNYMYAYNTWVEYISYLKGTSFRINKDAYERIKKAVVTLYMMSTKSENDIHLFANSMAGRHPLIGGTEITFKKDLFKKLIETGGDILGTGIDAELAAQYNYFFMEDFYTGVNKADVDGFYQFNYSPAGIYRQNNWVATMRCPTTKFWGGEVYSKTNRFGRYQAHGTLEVMYDGAMENSGFPKKNASLGTKVTGGWDWNVEAGATTVHYTSWKEMMPNKNVTDRFDQYLKTTNFAGALAWKDCGMFGAEFDQDDSWGSLRFTPTNLTFKKSVYAFDGMLISLGSNISASGAYGDDMITATNLFQGIDSEVSGDLVVNGETMAAGAEAKTNDSSADLWMVTPQGTGYFVPKGNDPIIIKHGEQSSPNETGDNVDDPVTVTAAKAYINHGVKTSGKEYVFVAVPATNVTDMAELAAKMANKGGEIFEIKAQNEKLHALAYKPAKVTAYSIFTAVDGLNFGRLKSTASEMLLMEKPGVNDKMLSLAISNPNLRPQADNVYGWVATPTQTSIVLDGEWVLNGDAIDGVTITPQSDKTTKIDLTLTEGEPVYIDLVDKDAVGITTVDQSEQAHVYTAGHDVFVVNAVGTAMVYDVAGQVIKSVDVDGSARFTLDQQGCYIVKISDKTVKVVIR